MECVLYENENKKKKKISSYLYDKSITLDEFLRKVTFFSINFTFLGICDRLKLVMNMKKIVIFGGGSGLS